jgi:hypothetical protein
VVRRSALAGDAGATLSYETVTPIAERQIALEDGAARRGRPRGSPLVVRDSRPAEHRGLLAPPLRRRAAWVERARARAGGRYLLGDVDAPWVEDPVRPTRRTATRAAAFESCCASSVRGEVLGGSDWSARIADAERLGYRVARRGQTDCRKRRGRCLIPSTLL